MDQILPITNVQVHPVRDPKKGKLRAYARVVIADQLQLTGLRIYQSSQTGLFVSYPNDPMYEGEDYRQLFYPITRQLRDAIELAVLRKLHLMLSITLPDPLVDMESLSAQIGETSA